MKRSKKIEVYYSTKSKTLYVITPDGKSYFVTNKGEVGATTGSRGTTVYSLGGGSSMFENASLVCELTPSVIRKLRKILP